MAKTRKTSQRFTQRAITGGFLTDIGRHLQIALQSHNDAKRPGVWMREALLNLFKPVRLDPVDVATLAATLCPPGKDPARFIPEAMNLIAFSARITGQLKQAVLGSMGSHNCLTLREALQRAGLKERTFLKRYAEIYGPVPGGWRKRDRAGVPTFLDFVVQKVAEASAEERTAARRKGRAAQRAMESAKKYQVALDAHSMPESGMQPE